MPNSSNATSSYLLNQDHSLGYKGKTQNWEENLELKIRMPPDLHHGLGGNSRGLGQETKRPLSESECKVYLIVTLSVALTFCVLSATIVFVACFKKYQEVKAHERAESLEKEEKEQMARTEVKSVAGHAASLSSSSHNLANGNGNLYSGLHYPHASQSVNGGHNGQFYAGQHHSATSNKPVTVRSVKR